MRIIRKIAKILSSPIRSCVQHELIKQDVRNEGRYAFQSTIEMELKRRATATSTDYVESHMKGVKSFDSRLDLLTLAIEKTDKSEGKILCEFGVFSGNSINHIASLADNQIFGFDSFEGLPEHWYGKYDKGHFAVEKLPEVRSNVTLIKGWFDDTLPEFIKEHPEPVALLHVDCDLYSSTKTVLNLLEKQLLPGCVIVFDEYFNYPYWQDGEYKAFQEFIRSSGLSYEYIAYSSRYEQVAVKLIG